MSNEKRKFTHAKGNSNITQAEFEHFYGPFSIVLLLYFGRYRRDGGVQLYLK